MLEAGPVLGMMQEGLVWPSTRVLLLSRVSRRYHACVALIITNPGLKDPYFWPHLDCGEQIEENKVTVAYLIRSLSYVYDGGGQFRS